MAREMKFDSEVYKIEDDITNHFLNSPLLAGKDPLFVRILILFITRKNLTQATLREITGMSAGRISQDVNTLLDMDLIEIAETSKKGKITYRAKSAGIVFLSMLNQLVGGYLDSEETLIEMKEDLEGNHTELGHLKGYKRLRQLTDVMIKIITSYKKTAGTLNKAIDSLEKEEN